MNLKDSVNKLPLVGPVYVKRLNKLGISTIKDLIYHAPHRYLDFRLASPISRTQPGETVTLKGEVTSIKNQYTKSRKKIQFAEIKDNTGTISIVWFNQPFLIKNIKKGDTLSLSGKIDWFGRKKAMISPEYEKLSDNSYTVHTGRLVPIYPETAGVSSKWIRGRINFLFPLIENQIKEILPKEILERYSLAGLKTSLKNIHFPKDHLDAKYARKRLSFDELLMLQLANLYKKIDWDKNEVVHKLDINRNAVNKFLKSLPFEFTKSQKRVSEEIIDDLEKDTPMNRLLEGDVGSGKTVIAALASFISFANEKQSVFMAPTQILAQQHFNTLKEIFDPFNVRISLVTSAGVESGPGKTDIFVGTHSLIHKKVKFDNVSLVVIDEQQRFGVEQRAHLITQTGKKRKAPHVLTMTATPIPRTVMLTLYGDLDLSTLDELPKGRQQITTWVVPPQKRKGAYSWIEKQIVKDKVQVFVICPLIEESEIDSMKQVKAANAEYKKLSKLFSSINLGLLHGKLKIKEKKSIMTSFKEGKVNILVSTPVVEVGIDVPNATIMVIEGAERFGLAQLHQLRGRVGRGDKKSYCLLFTEVRSKKVRARLSALQKSLSGFELAEIDLNLRGPGEIFGTKQHGFIDLKIATWRDTGLIKKAKIVAQDALNYPEKYSSLMSIIKNKSIAPN